MSITQSQFISKSFDEFYKVGGSFTNLESSSNDLYRQILQAEITEGYSIKDISQLSISLYNISLQSSRNVFTQECFEYNCLLEDGSVIKSFEEEGLITTKSTVSSICYTEWEYNGTTKYDFIDKKKHPLLSNAKCYEVVEEGKTVVKKKYLVRGTKDINGHIYLADIGYISAGTNEFVLVEENVPFYRRGMDNTLTARSISRMPVGIKVVKIKKVTPFNARPIGIVYGRLNNPIYLPHLEIKPNRELKSKDQNILVEELALSYLLLSSLRINNSLTNTTIYRNNNYSVPVVESSIHLFADTLIKFSNLVVDSDLPLNSSIPKYINNFNLEINRFNNSEEEFERTKSFPCFEEECFEEECFKESKNNLLPIRDIDNRAICWCILFLCNYKILYSQSEEVIVAIENLNEYLEQQTSSRGLLYKGWIDTNPEEYYTKALEKDEEESSSTNSIYLISLLKSFELTQDISYIKKAVDVENAIYKYFVTSQNLFSTSFQIKTASLESVTYQLLLSKATNNYQHLDSIIKYLNLRFEKGSSKIKTEDIITTNNKAEVFSKDNQFININDPSIILNRSDTSLFAPEDIDNINNKSTIAKYNYLIYSIIKELNIEPEIKESLKERNRRLLKRVAKYRKQGTLIFLSSVAHNHQSFLSIESSKINTSYLLETYKYLKETTFLEILKNIPQDYGWFNPKILNINSELGKFLYSISTMIAEVKTYLVYLKDIEILKNQQGEVLNRKALELGIVRDRKESDTDLKNRIIEKVNTEKKNLELIRSSLSYLGTKINTSKENHKSILHTEGTIEDTKEESNSKWGIGLLAGKKIASSNITTFVINQPIEEVAIKEIEALRPIGTKIDLVENLSFEIASNLNYNTYVRVIEVDSPCSKLTTEDKLNITTEDGASELCI